MKRIAMIPARLGSTRVPKKNLRFLGDKPLLAWAVETAIASKLFDEVVVNTESDEIGALAIKLGAGVYFRRPELAADGATSEHFVRDFLEKMPCDQLFQITPTSPFLSIRDMRDAVALLDAGAKTVLSVRRIQAECMLNGTGVNFDVDAPMPPSQDLAPVYSMCNGIFGWDAVEFMQLYDERGSATYGRSGNVSLLEINGDAAIDIDTEEDFAVAEAVLARRRAGAIVLRWWTAEAHAEVDASTVLLADGVGGIYDFGGHARPSINLCDVLDSYKGEGVVRVVQTPTSSATIISQMPGHGNRLHYHPDLDEWWLILEGVYDYEVEGVVTRVKSGDVISIPRGKWHRITAMGADRASRLAVSRDKVEHVYHD